MNWLSDLLFNPDSIAHIVALYAFVIAAGVLLGKIKVFGVSLGVTFVLFVGILVGHFGFTGNTSILNFVQDFGLILFVFCIGLQVGPSFFSSFKKGGVAMNMVAVGIVALNSHEYGCCRHSGSEHCCGFDSVFRASRQGGHPDDGRYLVWCRNQHSRPRCRK